MLLSIVSVLGGFMLLIKGADYLVDGSSAIARRLGVSTLVIGLTFVAFGTSAPELVVNILSATSGSTELAFSNINGSNIANILLILGFTALIGRIPVKSRTVMKEIPFMLLAGIMLIVFVSDPWLNGISEPTISRIDGIALLGFFVIFMYYLILSSRDLGGAKVEAPKLSLPLASTFTVFGLAGLVIGGKLAVDGATDIALGIGVSETLVGLTVVALGTSLPELVSSIVAARKGETDLAIGNVVGSNIFNILLVLGVTSIITPIPVSGRGIEDALFALAAMLIFFFALFLNRLGKSQKGKGLDKRTGAVFLAIYIAYIAYIVYIVVRG